MRTTKMKIGEKWGRLTVLNLIYGSGSGVIAECKCECGAIKEHKAAAIASGRIKSCGCYSRQACIDRSRTHGLTKSKVYQAWSNMKGRCLNSHDKKYSYYGGRGIRVCKEWLSEGGFDRFYSYIGDPPSLRHSIDRINVNGDYEPGNIRWATDTQQARNTRRNRYITHNGETLCVSGWADRFGISSKVLSSRINKQGWDFVKAISKSVRPCERIFAYNGESLSISQWSRKLGIGFTALSSRLITGKWPVEKAFTTPVKKRESAPL